MRELVPQDAGQYLFPGHFRFHDAAGEFRVVGVALREGGQEELILGGEMAEQRRVGHVRPGGNVPQGCPLVAVLGEAC